MHYFIASTSCGIIVHFLNILIFYKISKLDKIMLISNKILLRKRAVKNICQYSKLKI